MRKILLILIIGFSLFSWNNVIALDIWQWLSLIPVINEITTLSNSISITVTEDIPWANCYERGSTDGIPRYICDVEEWFKWVTSTMWAIIKWFTYLTWLWAILFIIINSLMYMASWVDDSAKANAKKNIQRTLIWIVLLLLTWVMLNIIAPWVYK